LTYKRGQNSLNPKLLSVPPTELLHGWTPLAGTSMKRRENGFTLIELLVVISIISILASMMLPGLAAAKEKGKVANCINNLRQMGISIKLYIDDNDFRFPASRITDTDGVQKRVLGALGGADPQSRFLGHFPRATRRPLNAYMRPSNVYKCTSDKGQALIHIDEPSELVKKPSDFDTLGMSYHYNSGELIILDGGGFRKERAGGLASQTEDWVTQPERYILMHEPPARLYPGLWSQWHYSMGRSEIDDPVYARQRFISPVLFVDGHVAVHNFSKSLSTDPYFPYEATKDWMWYKPVKGDEFGQ